MSTAGTSDLCFSPEDFGEIFPFHVGFGADGILTHVGRSMRRLSARARPGVPITDVIEPQRPEGPFAFARLDENKGQLYTVREPQTGVLLRGAMQRLGDLYFFLGSPWLNDTGSLSAIGLTLKDFAVHDPTLDLLQLLQLQKIAADDMRRLMKRLTNRSEELRLRTQEARKQEAEARKLALVAARTDNAIILTDARGCIEWVNEGFTRITGFELAECGGKTATALLSGPATDSDTITYMESRMQHGDGYKVEVIQYRKDGRYYWAAIEMQPIRDEAGKLVRFMAIGSDVTIRRQNADNLRTQFGVARLLAAAPDARSAGAQILATVGSEMDWLIGVLWLVAPAGDRLECAEVWQRPGSGVDDFVAAFRHRTFASDEALPGRAWAAGESIWLSDAPGEPSFRQTGAARECGLHCGVAVPVVAGGVVFAVLEFFSRRVEEPDGARHETLKAVSSQYGQFVERLRAEEALRQHSDELTRVNFQLAEAARLKDVFLASMSHELRTPLTGILGMAETLLDQVYGPLNEKQLQYLKIVENSGRHLLAVINDILDLAKLEAGQQPLRRQACAVQQICEAALRGVRPAAEKRRQNPKLDNHVPGAMVSIDSRLVIQCLHNLLGNAAKFTPEGGEFGVRVDSQPGEILITVWDRGIGIAPADQAKLFQPFTQIDGRLSRRYEGTGLGLALVKKIVELHGGTISVFSVPGQGSEFSVSLPWDGATDGPKLL